MRNRNRRTSRMTIGLDLGDKYSHVRVLDAEGCVTVAERIRTTREDVRKRFAEIEPALVALEAGTHSSWVSRIVEECGHQVIVANPRQTAPAAHPATPRSLQSVQRRPQPLQPRASRTGR